MLRTNIPPRLIVLLALATASFGSIAFGQERLLVTNSRLQLGTEMNLSASIRCGDLDGDGDIDLVVANGRHWPQQNYIFLNDGRAGFTIMRPLGDDQSTSYACELADLDEDGDLDIVTGNARAPCHIFVNDGLANFTWQASLAEISSVRSLTVSDISGDALPDILVTCRGRPNRAHFNQGNFDFTKVVPFGSQQDSTIDVAVADIDNDERLELLLANRDAQCNTFVRRTGAAFSAHIPIGNARADTRAVAVADFNSDGRLDAAFANIGSANSIVFGTPGETFGETQHFGEAARTYCLAAADIDLDGDVDLVAGNVGDRNSIFFNLGKGTAFTEVRFGSPDTATYGLCIGDFDADEYPDVAVANSNAVNSVFLNRPNRPWTQTESPRSSIRTRPDATSAAIEATSDWPMFRGPGATGVAHGFSLPTQWDASAEGEQHVLWRTKVPGLGHSSPVLVGNRLFVASALAEKGDAPLQVGRSGAPEAADDNGSQSWLVLCYDKRTGEQLWKRTAHTGIPKATRHAKATHASSTLAIEGDHVVAFFGSEGLYCYDLEGKLKWKRDLGVVNISKYGIGWGYASSPAIHDGRIVLVCDDPDNPYVIALSLHTGAELWRVSRMGDSERSWGSPLVVPDDSGTATQVVINGWPSVVSYRLKDGQELWRIRGGGDNPIPTPFLAQEHIFVTSAHGADSPIHAIHPSARGDITESLQQTPNANVLWSEPRGGCYMSTPVVLNNLLFLGNSNGILRCYHAGTGEKIYEKRLGSKAGMIASLVAGDGKIYCTTESGTVYVIAADEEFHVVAENQMAAPCFASPAISQGVLYFRTTQELIAIQ